MIVIAGKNDIAIHGLLLAIEYFNLDEIIVITNKNDLGVNSWQQSLFKVATEQGVVIKSLNEVYNSKIDYFISLEFDQIVRPEKFSTENLYNIHFSKLPKYKGMYTSVWPILFGDKETGVTLHKIDFGIDTGDIVAQKIFGLTKSDRSQDCYRKYIENSKQLLSDWFKKIIDGKIAPTNQAAVGASYYSTKTIDYTNLEIDFNKTAWQIQRQVYAFSFRPYQLLNFNKKEVTDVVITEQKSTLSPGTVTLNNNNYTLVSTIDYDIKFYFDRLSDLLEEIPVISVKRFSECIVNILGVNDRNKKGWSPIIVAAYHGRKDLIEFLIKNGADINDKNYRGTTVLMYAKYFSIKKRNNEFFTYLIKLGANPALKDWSGKTICDYITTEQIRFLGLQC